MITIEEVKAKDGTLFRMTEEGGIFIIENTFTCGACFHFEQKSMAIHMMRCIEKAKHAI